MLQQRIITAVVLLAILGAALWAPSPWPFIVVLSLACACACWEWLRLTLPASKRGGVAVGAAVALFVLTLCLTALWTAGAATGAARISLLAVGDVLLPLVAVIWLVAVTIVVVRGRADAPSDSLVWSVFSVCALLTAWAALAHLFLHEGAWFIVSLLIVVWVADIAAYFAGKAFGKTKLAPRVSPGKTVEGALAGVAGAVIWIGVSSFWPGTFAAALVARWSYPSALLIAALLGVISIIGDLFESLLKRRAGIKDSSNLLPGHGGVYDRIDAILPVAPLALFFLGALF
jgi:phosphatidate cytidylyltransferase